MSPAQKRLRELRDRQSRERGRMAELALADELNDEQRQELDTIEKGTPDLERQLRAAQVAVDDEDRQTKVETGTAQGDAEQRGADRVARPVRGRALPDRRAQRSGPRRCGG